MTTLDVEDGRIIVRFTGRHAVMAFARAVTVPVRDVLSVEVVGDGFDLDLGSRVGGTSVPRRLHFGRFRKHPIGRTFAALYCGEPAVVISTAGGDWDRVAVTVADPDGAAGRVRLAAGLAT